MTLQPKHSSPDRVFRAAVLNGVPVPEQTRATLEARGVDTAELEQRIRQQIEWRH
jgi:hypothetical protein